MAENRAGLWVAVVIGVVAVAAGGIVWLRGDLRGRAEEAPETNLALETLRVEFGEEVAKVAAGRKTWDLDFRPWIGREAGDFAVMGIDGKMHRLSDYRGKEVAVVFWATWCPACNEEIPHLIELRKRVGADRLAVLAISNEPVEVLRPFVEAKGINYTVATLDSRLPEPFSGVTGIPTTFFVNPEGKVKLAAVGLISLEESLAIVNAGK